MDDALAYAGKVRRALWVGTTRGVEVVQITCKPSREASSVPYSDEEQASIRENGGRRKIIQSFVGYVYVSPFDYISPYMTPLFIRPPVCTNIARTRVVDSHLL